MNLRKALLGILVLGLAGCSLAPFYQRPALPTAASYPGLEDAAGATAPSVDQVGWRDFFADLRLQELIAQALANNRDLRLAMARVEEARGLYGVQRADQFPNISGVATGEKYRLPADLSPTGNSLVTVRNEAREWNRAVTANGKPEMRVDLERAIRSRQKAHRLPKQLGELE